MNNDNQFQIGELVYRYYDNEIGIILKRRIMKYTIYYINLSQIMKDVHLTYLKEILI